jgi:hypothetical protein
MFRGLRVHLRQGSQTKVEREPFRELKSFGGRLVIFKCRMLIVRGGADKSLARPGTKQATATKLGIYSTYSPRSLIHFLARCSDFCGGREKTKVVRPTRSPRQQCPQRRTKNGDLSIVFSVQGPDGSPTGSDPENRVSDQDF